MSSSGDGLFFWFSQQIGHIQLGPQGNQGEKSHCCHDCSDLALPLANTSPGWGLLACCGDLGIRIYYFSSPPSPSCFSFPLVCTLRQEKLQRLPWVPFVMTLQFPLETGITQPSHYRGRFWPLVSVALVWFLWSFWSSRTAKGCS